MDTSDPGAAQARGAVVSIRHQRFVVFLLGVAMLVLAVFLFWRYIMLALVGVTAWRVALARLLPRRRRGRAVSALHKWADTAALAAIAWRVGPAKRERMRSTPTPVYKGMGPAETQSDEIPF